MRIRLKAPCFFNNHLYQAGEIIDLPEGMEGPHKSKTVTHDQIDYGTDPSIDANRILGKVDLEPLFDVVEDEPRPEGESKPAVLLEKPDAAKDAATVDAMKPANLDS